jgi:hypothetical protein
LDQVSDADDDGYSREPTANHVEREDALDLRHVLRRSLGAVDGGAHGRFSNFGPKRFASTSIVAE